MKIQTISDLHTCFYHNNSLDNMLRHLNFEPHLDVLLLAGDIIVPGDQTIKECRRVFDYLSTKANHIIYVTGNHEFYHSDYETTEDKIQSILPPNFHRLNNSDVTLEGQHFYGGTLWFRNNPLNQIYESQMNDFSLIQGIHNWVYDSNAEFRSNAMKLMTDKTIVISHHMPSPICTPMEYRGSTINRFFVSDETELIMEKQPKVWVAGHSHTFSSGLLGKTRVVVNPYGYPFERGTREYSPVIFDVKEHKNE